jgi:hypothetical protein
MTRDEVIQKTLWDMNMVSEAGDRTCDEETYSLVVGRLRERLPDSIDIKTCEDFKHLGAECCDTCHHFYSESEMKFIDLPDGGKGWVCDQVEWAIYPERLQELEEWSREQSVLYEKLYGKKWPF